MEKTIQMTAPVLEQCDVLVIGGGPSGIAAAIAAARLGKEVVILELAGQLGGMATQGNVGIFMSVGNITGFYKELLEKLIPEKLASADANEFYPQFNPLQFRYLVTRMVKNENIKVYYHTRYAAPLKDGERITGVMAVTREGMRAFMGKTVIDCSGDARVAIDCGTPYHAGRPEDGLTQPVTMMFQMQDTGRPVRRSLPEGCYEYQSVEELPQGRLLFWKDPDTNTLLVNMTRVKGNGALVKDINQFEEESLRQVFSVADYLQRNGFETYVLSAIAPQTGVRESNQIVGLHTLSDQDVTTAKKFEDVVAQTNYEIDIHNPDGGASTDERKIDSYDIPYRCMVPQGVKGLLVSGRCISASHTAMASLRVMPTCFALGQAAGIAAAIAADSGAELAEVDIKLLHQYMKEQGVSFD